MSKNYARYGYNSFRPGKWVSYTYNPNHLASTNREIKQALYAKKKRDAAKKGYYTDIDYYYGNVLGKSSPYEYRKKALENNVSELDLISPDLTLTAGETNFFHHLLIDPVHMNVFASGLGDASASNVSYNILEIDALVSLNLHNTNSQLVGCSCYMVVCPNVYDYQLSNKLVDPSRPLQPANLKTTIDYYMEANQKLEDMLGSFEKENAACDPVSIEGIVYPNTQLPFREQERSGASKYQIDSKFYAQIKPSSGLKKIHFKFKANKEISDVTLRKKDAIFFVIECNPYSVFPDFTMSISSHVIFKYSKNS